MNWLIRQKVTVQTLAETVKGNKKNISLATFSQQTTGKNSESKIKLP